MPEVRRRFDSEFQAGAVRIVGETGKPIAQVAPAVGEDECTFQRPFPVRFRLAALLR